MTNRDKAVVRQREYYSQTAAQYNAMHVTESGEHEFALSVMMGLMEPLGIHSVLDVGSGTGRAISRIRMQLPQTALLGIEPVSELRSVGYANGIARSELIDGDATALAIEAGSWDLVCAFGVLHHVSRPRVVVAEMLRVAAKAIFISDCNNFGQGSLTLRTIKQALNSLGLWPLADYVKTQGRGYTISTGDGVSYSYSLFNDFSYITQRSSRVHLINTGPTASNLYRTASHVGLLAIKQRGDDSLISPIPRGVTVVQTVFSGRERLHSCSADMGKKSIRDFCGRSCDGSSVNLRPLPVADLKKRVIEVFLEVSPTQEGTCDDPPRKWFFRDFSGKVAEA